MNVVDSSAWMEYFIDGPNASYFSGAIEKLSDLLVPTICIYEVFKKVLNEQGEAEAFGAVSQMKLGRVVDVDEEIALSAARISIAHKLPMADSLILAVAQGAKAMLWTQDEHFKGISGVKYRPTRK
jgi:toxin FitB